MLGLSEPFENPPSAIPSNASFSTSEMGKTHEDETSEPSVEIIPWAVSFTGKARRDLRLCCSGNCQSSSRPPGGRGPCHDYDCCLHLHGRSPLGPSMDLPQLAPRLPFAVRANPSSRPSPRVGRHNSQRLTSPIQADPSRPVRPGRRGRMPFGPLDSESFHTCHGRHERSRSVCCLES